MGTAARAPAASPATTAGAMAAALGRRAARLPPSRPTRRVPLPRAAAVRPRSCAPRCALFSRQRGHGRSLRAFPRRFSSSPRWPRTTRRSRGDRLLNAGRCRPGGPHASRPRRGGRRCAVTGAHLHRRPTASRTSGTSASCHGSSSWAAGARRRRRRRRRPPAGAAPSYSRHGRFPCPRHPRQRVSRHLPLHLHCTLPAAAREEQPLQEQRSPPSHKRLSVFLRAVAPRSKAPSSSAAKLAAPPTAPCAPPRHHPSLRYSPRLRDRVLVRSSSLPGIRRQRCLLYPGPCPSYQVGVVSERLLLLTAPALQVFLRTAVVFGGDEPS